MKLFDKLKWKNSDIEKKESITMKDNKTSNNLPHEKIIKKLCKEILLPAGIFQRGSSRLYIDDNGYFFTLIEFQPSPWSKGIYLNIALHFLWNEKDYFSYDFPFTGSRVREYVEYHDDEQFEKEVKSYVEAALKQALFYRKLRNIKAAEKYAEKMALKHKNHPYVKELDVLKMLDNEDVLQRIKRTRAFWHSKPSMKKMPYNKIYDDNENPN